MENGAAVGVEYRLTGKKESRVERAYASGEVILCGGVINSPQLLELSGIGDREHLESLGVDVKHHLPGVGENLQDHLTINVQQGLHGVPTFYEETPPAGDDQESVQVPAQGHWPAGAPGGAGRRVLSHRR